MRVLFTILAAILLTCNLPEKNNHDASYKEKPVIDDTLLLSWQADSLGCNGYRNGKVLKEIFEKYGLNTKGVNDVIFFLGKANEDYVNDRYYGFRYYSENSCVDGKLPPESEKCWYEVLVSKVQGEESGYAKACQ